LELNQCRTFGAQFHRIRYHALTGVAIDYRSFGPYQNFLSSSWRLMISNLPHFTQLLSQSHTSDSESQAFPKESDGHWPAFFFQPIAVCDAHR
jgi:hypothetical protein